MTTLQEVAEQLDASGLPGIAVLNTSMTRAEIDVDRRRAVAALAKRCRRMVPRTKPPCRGEVESSE